MSNDHKGEKTESLRYANTYMCFITDIETFHQQI